MSCIRFSRNLEKKIATHWAVLNKIPFQNLSPGLAIMRLASTLMSILALAMDARRRTTTVEDCLETRPLFSDSSFAPAPFG